jgi:hypothetical protein
MTILLLFWIVPIILCGFICEQKHRSVAKGVFVGFFLGWIAVVCLWLGLKTRDPLTRMLY